MITKIGCIVVLYNPDVSLLLKSLDSVKNQVDSVFISDNSTDDFNKDLLFVFESVIYEKMPGNIGIAAAQNVGIRYFMEQNFSHIIFLDQDSIMVNGMVEQLLTDMRRLESKSIGVGAIGARSFHRESNKSYRGLIKKGKFVDQGISEMTELISSASLIATKNFKNVGLLEEDLFIDAVDFEWCWRAAHINKLRFFISEKVQLSHQVGEGDRNLVLRDVAIPTPFRTYYQFRNYFILARRSYVPLYWKLSNGFKFFIKFFYYSLILPQRKTYLMNMIKGIKDGIVGI